LICGALALKNSRFCFHHSRTQQSRRVLSDISNQRRYEYANGNHRTLMAPNAHRNFDDLGVHLFQALELPALTDASSCLIAIDAVTQALATQQIPSRTATALKGLIRTAIMLHERYQEELQEAQERPEQRVEENPVRPPHHMSHGYSYNADGELEPDFNAPAPAPESEAEEAELISK
jgi:hypothetical protein